MAIYTALISFIDTKDNNRLYRAGDIFPCNGITVPAERIKELSGNSNKLGKPVIAEIPEEVPTTEIIPAEKKRGRKKAG